MPSFTKQAIMISFMNLLNEQPLSQITIKDIVEKCGINRNSFYYHFSDLPDLVETVLEEEADKIIEEHADIDSLEDCLLAAVGFALNNKKAVLHIYSSASREAYDRYLNRVCKWVVESYIDRVAGDLPLNESDKRIIIKYYKCELSGFVLDWMNDGMRYDICDQIKRICELFEGTAQTAFQRSVES